MDYGVVWTRRALADLEALVRYIARDDQVAAGRFGRSILSKVEKLVRFPEAGRVVPEYGLPTIREMILPPYRIVYEFDEPGRALTVLRIWHGARGELQLR